MFQFFNELNEQPDWDEINKALKDIQNPRFFPIETGDDDATVIIAPEGTTDRELAAFESGFVAGIDH